MTVQEGRRVPQRSILHEGEKSRDSKSVNGEWTGWRGADAGPVKQSPGPAHVSAIARCRTIFLASGDDINESCHHTCQISFLADQSAAFRQLRYTCVVMSNTKALGPCPRVHCVVRCNRRRSGPVLRASESDKVICPVWLGTSCSSKYTYSRSISVLPTMYRICTSSSRFESQACAHTRTHCRGYP